MKILFIKLKNIGDALLMTPALTAARELWPAAQIDVLVRASTEGIVKGSLAISNIYTTAAPETHKRGWAQFWQDVRLVGRLRRQKYDWIFELGDNDRGRVMAIAIGGGNLAAHTFKNFSWWARPFFNRQSSVNYNQGFHRAEKDVQLLREFCGYAGNTPALQFDRSFADWSYVQSTGVASPVVVHAVSRWKRKMWPLEKWKILVGRLSQQAPVILTSGRSADEVAFTRQIAAVNPSRISVTGGGLDWPQMAGLLYSARMLLTLDTATMHLGAACRVPMVAILGPTDEKLWGPWSCPHELVTPRSAPGVLPTDRVITGVDLEEVWGRCQKVLSEVAIKGAF